MGRWEIFQPVYRRPRWLDDKEVFYHFTASVRSEGFAPTNAARQTQNSLQRIEGCFFCRAHAKVDAVGEIRGVRHSQMPNGPLLRGNSPTVSKVDTDLKIAGVRMLRRGGLPASRPPEWRGREAGNLRRASSIRGRHVRAAVREACRPNMRPLTKCLSVVPQTYLCYTPAY